MCDQKHLSRQGEPGKQNPSNRDIGNGGSLHLLAETDGWSALVESRYRLEYRKLPNGWILSEKYPPGRLNLDNKTHAFHLHKNTKSQKNIQNTKSQKTSGRQRRSSFTLGGDERASLELELALFGSEWSIGVEWTTKDVVVNVYGQRHGHVLGMFVWRRLVVRD
jgi:hypothetical protein